MTATNSNSFLEGRRVILLCVETDAEGIVDTSLEAVSFARALRSSTAGIELHAAVFGDVPTGIGEKLAAYGVDAIHHIHGDAFRLFSGAARASALHVVQERTGATVIAAAGTARGNEVLAHLGARLNRPMAANVIGVAQTNPLVVIRQVVGGAALEDMLLDEQPALFTVAGHSSKATPFETLKDVKWYEEEPVVSPADLEATIIDVEHDDKERTDSLKTARVVVGAGRGASGPDGFEAVVELAQLLHGAVGVSRVVTSLGWRPHHEQIGQTGSSISPELYIPCGISGAIQHWAGCSSSKTILAINTDPEAPMVAKATYAVIGDMHEIIPAITQEIVRRSRGKR